MPALFKRSSAPIQSSRSGFTGFLTITGMSTPFNESAISCTEKGFTVVLAPGLDDGLEGDAGVDVAILADAEEEDAVEDALHGFVELVVLQEFGVVVVLV